MTDKVAFILPGYGFDAESEPYIEVGEMFAQRDVIPEYVEIGWSQDLNENIEQAERNINERLEEYEEPEIYLFGHSWGAVCAFAASPKFKPEAQILASLSPDFKEDRELFSNYQKRIGNAVSTVLGKLRVIDVPEEDYERPSLEDLKDEELGRIHFLYAEREYKGWFGINALGFGGEITENRKDIFPDADETVVPNATHYMTSNAYLDGIERVIDEFIGEIK